MVVGAILPVHSAAEAYDEYASRYDRLLEENRINAYMRAIVSQSLISTFGAGKRLIEIGCGTGDEALTLASHESEVFAFDPSPRMIQIASQKAVASGIGRNIRFFVGKVADLSRHLGDVSQKIGFDGAYASFSLSYEPDLSVVSNALAPWIRPDGWLVIASMNRLCGVELVAALLSAHPRLAGRRLQKHTLHKVGAYSTPVFPRTTKDVADALRDHFHLEDVRALPAVLPPHYANRAFARWPALLDILTDVDPYLAPLPVVRWLGDHNLLRFRRNN